MLTIIKNNSTTPTFFTMMSPSSTYNNNNENNNNNLESSSNMLVGYPSQFRSSIIMETTTSIMENDFQLMTSQVDDDVFLLQSIRKFKSIEQTSPPVLSNTVDYTSIVIIMGSVFLVLFLLILVTCIILRNSKRRYSCFVHCCIS